MQNIWLYLFFLLFIFTSACDKSSCIQGVVTDSKTGKPVAGASVKLMQSYFEHDARITLFADVSTDTEGVFSYCAEEKSSGHISAFEVSSAGYSGKFESAAKEKGCNEVGIILTPLDGLLHLTIANTSGQYDSIYIYIKDVCDGMFGYHRLPVIAPLRVMPGASTAQNIPVCSGNLATISWTFEQNSSSFVMDSISIETGDTTFFQLHY